MPQNRKRKYARDYQVFNCDKITIFVKHDPISKWNVIISLKNKYGFYIQYVNAKKWVNIQYRITSTKIHVRMDDLDRSGLVRRMIWCEHSLGRKDGLTLALVYPTKQKTVKDRESFFLITL